MEKCFLSYGSKSQKVHSLKGEFLCVVFLEGQGNLELGYSGIQQEQCCVPRTKETSGWRGREREKPGWELRKVQVGKWGILEASSVGGLRRGIEMDGEGNHSRMRKRCMHKGLCWFQLQHIFSMFQLCFSELTTVYGLIAGLFCNFFLASKGEITDVTTECYGTIWASQMLAYSSPGHSLSTGVWRLVQFNLFNRQIVSFL